MSGSSTLVLPAEFTIMDVEHWQSQLQVAMAENDQLSLSAIEVQRIDSAAMQLLTSFFQTCQQQHRVLSWQDTSEIFLASAELLGMSEALGLSEDAN